MAYVVDYGCIGPRPPTVKRNRNTLSPMSLFSQLLSSPLGTWGMWERKGSTRWQRARSPKRGSLESLLSFQKMRNKDQNLQKVPEVCLHNSFYQYFPPWNCINFFFSFSFCLLTFLLLSSPLLFCFLPCGKLVKAFWERKQEKNLSFLYSVVQHYFPTILSISSVNLNGLALIQMD